MVAARQGKIDVLELLVKHNADVDARTEVSRLCYIIVPFVCVSMCTLVHLHMLVYNNCKHVFRRIL